VQYTDYTVWQHTLLGDGADPDSLLSTQVDYWIARLADLPDELLLPTDRPRPAMASHAGDEIRFDLGPGLHRGIVELARESGATVFMVLQAAVAALLGKLGAGTDIPLGSPIAGRTDDALEDLVGFFTNTLVLRTDISGDPTFAQLLDRVRETDLAAYARQDVPFEYLVEVLNPARSMARHPLFQVMVVLQNTDDEPVPLPGLATRIEPISSTASQVDLTFQFVERFDGSTPAGVIGLLEFSTDLFDRSTVDAVAARLTRLLEAVTADPAARLATVDVLEPAERAALLRLSRGPDRPVGDGVMERIRAAGARTPNAIAVSDWVGSLDYATMLGRASALARRMDGGLVAVLASPGTGFLTAVLAALSCGGAYMPMDVLAPVGRLAESLVDSRAVAVVVDEEHREQARQVLAAAGSTASVLLLDEATDPMDALVALSGADDDLAYVIYTSGSTGRPKGAMVERAGMANHIWGKVDDTRLSGADTVVHNGPVTFDVSVWQMLGALQFGGRVVMVERATASDPVALFDVVVRERVTVLEVVPSMLRAALDAWDLAGGPVELPTLRYLVPTGDVLAPDLCARWFARFPDIPLVNTYGLTECSDDVAHAVITADGWAEGTRVPIGTPIRNTALYVLGEDLRPAPVGVPGELYVGGVAVGRGYLARPGLTATRFVADPFGPPGARLYRSGDSVVLRADGKLEFLQRRDNQIKIRGYRIEPGEIETALRSLPSVGDAAVQVGVDSGGHKRLIGYLVPALGRSSLDTGVVRRELGEVLPDYMMPALFSVLPELPLTAHGKLDRRALPTPDFDQLGQGRQPRTPAEQALCAVFTRVLGLRQVGADDDFFELGGHSLLAVRVVDRARKAGVSISIADVFTHRTPEALARAASLADTAVTRVFDEVRERAAGDTEFDPFAIVLAIRPSGGRPPLFCIHSGLGFSLPYLGLARHIDPTYPVYGIQSPSITTLAPSASTLTELAKSYVQHIRSVTPNGPYHLVGWSFGGLLAQEIAVHLRADGHQVGLLASLDGYPHAEDLAEHAGADDQEVFAWFLEFLGHGRAEFAGRTLSRHDIVDVLRHDRNPLAELGEERVFALLDAMRRTTDLTERHTPGSYDGELTLLVAQPTDAPDEVADRTARWASYAGSVRAYRVACPHDDMMDPGPQAEIGAVLDAELRRFSEGEEV
jgi:amino acid adenylation domain-containing protein